MKRLWSDDLSELEPYSPGEQMFSRDVIKLNTNENPYPPSQSALDKIRDKLHSNLRLYPDPDNFKLKSAIAGLHAIHPESVFVGNGSDEVLAHIFRGLFKKKKPLLFPDITYSFYPSYCNLFGIKYNRIKLDANFCIDFRMYNNQCGGIIFPNPNAPTGIGVKKRDIEAFLHTIDYQVPVVIDEAYVDFGGESSIPLVKKYPNLIVSRTLSKSHSLAGLRVGYAIGDADMIEALSRVKNSFNSYPVDALAEAGAIGALQDSTTLAENSMRIRANRDFLIRELEKLEFSVLPSIANFVFVERVGFDGEYLAKRLKEGGILVRNFNNPQRLQPFIRISVGSEIECKKLINLLGKIVKSRHI